MSQIEKASILLRFVFSAAFNSILNFLLFNILLFLYEYKVFSTLYFFSSLAVTLLAYFINKNFVFSKRNFKNSFAKFLSVELFLTITTIGLFHLCNFILDLSMIASILGIYFIRLLITFSFYKNFVFKVYD